MWNSWAVGQCNIAPPVNQEPSIDYSLSGVVGPALSARYPVSATTVIIGVIKKFTELFEKFKLGIDPYKL